MLQINKITFLIFSSLVFGSIGFAVSQTQIIEARSNQPVSYATISFGNGQGIFADDEGVFIFTKKLYPDIDSLYISALGFKELKLATATLPATIVLETNVDELDEIVLSVVIDKKFKKETIKPYLDDDYYKCWLPTIESEIAVFFPNDNDQLKKLTAVQFPIALESKDWNKRHRANADKYPFSTLFKVKFYKNLEGYPGQPLIQDVIVFRATEKHGDVFNLDVSNYNLYLPKEGFFVSLQVLGYTDDSGKLLPNKKYKEIKSREGIVKIPTNFRPLLPFTEAIPTNRTFIKRVFLQNNQWTRFETGQGIDSSLLKTGLNNYGIGITFNTFSND